MPGDPRPGRPRADGRRLAPAGRGGGLPADPPLRGGRGAGLAGRRRRRRPARSAVHRRERGGRPGGGGLAADRRDDQHPVRAGLRAAGALRADPAGRGAVLLLLRLPPPGRGRRRCRARADAAGGAVRAGGRRRAVGAVPVRPARGPAGGGRLLPRVAGGRRRAGGLAGAPRRGAGRPPRSGPGRRPGHAGPRRSALRPAYRASLPGRRRPAAGRGPRPASLLAGPAGVAARRVPAPGHRAGRAGGRPAGDRPDHADGAQHSRHDVERGAAAAAGAPRRAVRRAGPLGVRRGQARSARAADPLRGPVPGRRRPRKGAWTRLSGRQHHGLQRGPDGLRQPDRQPQRQQRPGRRPQHRRVRPGGRARHADRLRHAGRGCGPGRRRRPPGPVRRVPGHGSHAGRRRARRAHDRRS